MEKFTIQTLVHEPLSSGTQTSSDPDGMDQGYFWSTKDGKVTELNITYMDGTSEKRFVHSFLYDSIVYTRDMNFFQGEFEIELDTSNKPKLIAGDTTGVKVVDFKNTSEDYPGHTWTDYKATFTKPGLYVLDVDFKKFDFKIGEYDGKMFAAYEM